MGFAVGVVGCGPLIHVGRKSASDAFCTIVNLRYNAVGSSNGDATSVKKGGMLGMDQGQFFPRGSPHVTPNWRVLHDIGGIGDGPKGG